MLRRGKKHENGNRTPYVARFHRGVGAVKSEGWDRGEMIEIDKQ